MIGQFVHSLEFFTSMEYDTSGMVKRKNIENIDDDWSNKRINIRFRCYDRWNEMRKM